MTGRLAGKIALITGAGCVGPGWGNGRAMAVRFAEEGAKVFAVDRDLERMSETVERVRSAGGTIETYQADVTDSAAVAGMVQACVQRFGCIDVLVNNVGGSAAGGPVELSEEVWDAQVDANLKSVFLELQARAAGDGEPGAQAPSSTSPRRRALRWTGSAQVAYAATKAGRHPALPGCRGAVRAKGIRVNTVVPGQLHTPMVEARLAGQRAGGDVEALLDASANRAYRCHSWATAAIPPMPRCSSRPTRRASSPERRSSSTAA